MKSKTKREIEFFSFTHILSRPFRVEGFVWGDLTQGIALLALGYTQVAPSGRGEELYFMLCPKSWTRAKFMKSLSYRSKIVGKAEPVSGRRVWKNGEMGSTLIEAVVTMALVAILATVITLRINVRTSRVDGAAALLETHLLEVKEMAMATRQNVGICFDIENSRYEGVAVPSEMASSPEWNPGNPFANQPINVEMDIESLSTDLPGDVLCFDRMGRPVDPQGTLLTQRLWIEMRSGGRTQRLSIEPITGWIGR